jgi:TolB protein
MTRTKVQVRPRRGGSAFDLASAASPKEAAMQGMKFILVSLTGLALLAALAGATAASPSKTTWKIALSSDRIGGDPEIFSMNSDGSDVRRLTRAKGVDVGGIFSPDGRKLLYYSRGPSGHRGDVFVMNADGSGKRNLTQNPAYDSPGSWSPDVRKIVFTSNRDGNNEIYVMNSDGSGQQNVSPNPSTQEGNPQWSADGRTIAFMTDRDGNQEIYAMDADGGNARNLTRHPLNDTYAGFLLSPDGRRIAFASNRDTRSLKNLDIYVMNADGSDVRRLTRTPESEGPMSWSPDGRKLAFWRYPSQPRGAFFVMNADGSGVKKVTWSLPSRK